MTGTAAAGSGDELREAYRTCREIARREAKNFYYGFMALPRPKSDAMCAIYAFMRRADDISDDETVSVAERRVVMGGWMNAFRRNAAQRAQDAAIFPAVRDVQQRFGVSDALLEELVAGTSMDLSEELPAGVEQLRVGGQKFDVYRSFEALERYCYLVASVVGLTTIRIFGYSDPAAERHATDLGLAFQLTNILRDVKEDAARGRVYLPAELLARHGSSVEDVVHASRAGQVSPALAEALRELGSRAEQLYGAAAKLIPLLEKDSRSSMQVLVSIYHELLREIERAHYAVFEKRIRVSTPKKLSILVRGLITRGSPS